jgi:hypothetical protein
MWLSIVGMVIYWPRVFAHIYTIFCGIITNQPSLATLNSGGRTGDTRRQSSASKTPTDRSCVTIVLVIEKCKWIIHSYVLLVKDTNIHIDFGIRYHNYVKNYGTVSQMSVIFPSSYGRSYQFLGNDYSCNSESYFYYLNTRNALLSCNVLNAKCF